MGLFKRLTLFVVGVGALTAGGCIRKSATVPQTLAVKEPVGLEQLVDRINSYQEIKTISAQVEIGVTDYYSGFRYSDADGALRLQRPEKIRLKITAPIVNAEVVDMTSDGIEFRSALFRPKDKAMFVHGSNKLRSVRAEQIKDAKDPRLKEAGALANIRPQHITDAFIIKPIVADGNTEFFREEDIEIEPDMRPNKKGHFVNRKYYVLYVLQRSDSGKLHIRRKFWFDRTQDGTPLVRQQTFEDGDGVIGSDIVYGDFFYPGNSKWPWAQTVNITRPNDGYGMLVRLADKDSIQINTELPNTTFVLENTEHLKELDLDQSADATVTSSNLARPRPDKQ
jgi:hypothetical protein